MSAQRFTLGVCLGLLPLIIAACSNSSETIALTPSPPDAPPTEQYFGSQSLTMSPIDEQGSAAVPSSRLSRLFLVEQPSAQYSKQIGEAFRRDPPGGLVFWNSSKVGAKELAETVARYSRISKKKRPPPRAIFNRLRRWWPKAFAIWCGDFWDSKISCRL
jgi:hypothetical protein